MHGIKCVLYGSSVHRVTSLKRLEKVNELQSTLCKLELGGKSKADDLYHSHMLTNFCLNK